MPVAVKDHPQLSKIVDGILSRKSLREIGASVSPRVSANSVLRYKRHVIEPSIQGAGELTRSLAAIAKGELPEKAIDPVQVARVAMAADPYLARMVKHRETVDRNLAVAEAEGDGRTVASLIGVDLKGLELDARLTGRLDNNAGAGISIQINVGAGATVNAQMISAPAAVDISEIE